MLLALVDILRCPSAHEETSLVLSVESWSGQRVSEGLLGCPRCHARYPILQGSVDFTGDSLLVRSAGSLAPVEPIRLAAQLSLGEPGGIALLTGRYAACANPLAEIAGITCIVIDAPIDLSPTVTNMEVAARLPLADRVLRAAAVDQSRCSSTFLLELARCLRSGGRLVTPARTQLPPAMRLLAHDDLEAVAESQGFPPPIQLRRGH